MHRPLFSRRHRNRFDEQPELVREGMTCYTLLVAILLLVAWLASCRSDMDLDAHAIETITSAEPVLQAWLMPAILGAQALMGFLGARSDRKAHEKTQEKTVEQNAQQREWAAAQNAADRQLYMDYLDRMMGGRQDQLSALNPIANSLHGIENVDLAQFPLAFGTPGPAAPNMTGAAPAIQPLAQAPGGGGYGGHFSETMAALLPMLLAGRGGQAAKPLPSSPTSPTSMLATGPSVAGRGGMRR